MRIAFWSRTGAVFALALGLLAAGCSRGGGKGDIQDTGQEILGQPAAVLAKVGERPISLAEVDVLCSYWKSSGTPQAKNAQTKRELQLAALNSLIDQAVLAQEAEKRGVVVPDSVVDGMVNRWEGQFADATQRAQKLAEKGLTEAGVREKFRQDLLVRNFVETSVVDTIQVPDAEIPAYYNAHPEYFETTEVHARHILKKVDPGASPDSVELQRAAIAALLTRVRAGEDFAALAMANSDCPSAPKGGDLGFFARARMVQPFADSAFALPVGGVSGIVQTPFGFHIIKVEERRNEGTRPLEQVAPAIRQYLQNQRVQQAVDNLALRLRDKSNVKLKVKV
jgi:peptidyl-prolyl cis-trans isomerase C